jgi:thiosulfate/3-mercaptopyruvate sulfurtransferase
VSDVNVLISCEELKGIADDESVSIVDCRFSLDDPAAGRAQYLAGHLPNAVFADLDEDLAAPVTATSGRHPLPTPAEFARTLGRLGISNSTRVIAYDQAGGGLAARLWWMLRWAGHDKASVLDGGLSRWHGLGWPLEQGQEHPRPGTFEVTVDGGRILRTSEIVAAATDVRQLRLVDAREATRFLGEAEPIDPVAGRIPGALNAPFVTNLREGGTWKTADELREQWRDVLGGDLSSPWSVMCGSGVTACHHVMSALLAGLPEPRVYVGSWSEWIRDPARPVSSGPASEA